MPGMGSVETLKLVVEEMIIRWIRTAIRDGEG